MSTISLSINVNQLSPGWIRPSGELVSVGLFGFPSESLNARAAAARHDRRWSKLTEVVISSGEPKTGEPKSQTSRVGPSGPNTCFTQKGPLSREILDGRSSGSILMEVRKRTVFQTIFCGDIPLHRPYIGLIYGRYLQFRFLKWPLKIQAMTKLRWVNWFVKCAPYVPYSNQSKLWYMGYTVILLSLGIPYKRLYKNGLTTIGEYGYVYIYIYVQFLITLW